MNNAFIKPVFYILRSKYINSMTYFQQSLPFIFPPASLCSIQITDSCTLITDLRYEIKKIPPNVLSLYQINNKAYG